MCVCCGGGGGGGESGAFLKNLDAMQRSMWKLTGRLPSKLPWICACTRSVISWPRLCRRWWWWPARKPTPPGPTMWQPSQRGGVSSRPVLQVQACAALDLLCFSFFPCIEFCDQGSCSFLSLQCYACGLSDSKKGVEARLKQPSCGYAAVCADIALHCEGL